MRFKIILCLRFLLQLILLVIFFCFFGQPSIERFLAKEVMAFSKANIRWWIIKRRQCDWKVYNRLKSNINYSYKRMYHFIMITLGLWITNYIHNPHFILSRWWWWKAKETQKAFQHTSVKQPTHPQKSSIHLFKRITQECIPISSYTYFLNQLLCRLLTKLNNKGKWGGSISKS